MRKLFAYLAVLFVAPCFAQAAPLPSPEERQADLDAVFATEAAVPVKRHRGPLMRELEPLIVQQARFIVSEMRPWPVDANAALLPIGRRGPSSEDGIRPAAATAKGLALAVRLFPDEAFPADFTREQARSSALKLLRYLVRTHGVGEETCVDGKTWGGQWQSAYWASLAGEACWLLWDDLDPTERWLAARMVCDEADRFVGVKPPAQIDDDTKAEENAWNSEVISLALNQFAGHPRSRAWGDTANTWIASSFSTRADTTRTELVDKRLLKDWVSGANVHDDFTLENHKRVHPDYMACTYLLTSQVPVYAWGMRKAPAVLNLNVEAINAVIKRLATPDGSVLYPNGQDWGLRRNVDWLEYHGTMATLYGDRESAALLRQSLAAVKRMAAREPRGAIYLPGETKLSSDQHMMLEYMAHTYALMAQLGEGPEPLPAEPLQAALTGTKLFLDGRFGIVRTATSITSFSWGAQVLGQIVPLREDLVFSPEGRGLVGYVGVDGLARERTEVKRVSLAPLAEGFGLVGVLGRGEGAAEQRFGFLALPDGRAVYADAVTLGELRRPSFLHLGTLGVLNDTRWPYHDGKRTIYAEGAERTFEGAKARGDATAEFASRWLNVDGALGIVRLGASGPALYQPEPTSAAGRLEQRLVLNAVPASLLSSARPGDRLAHGVYVFYPNSDARGTAAFASRCSLLSEPGATPVRLRLDDGTEVSFDLEALSLKIVPTTPPLPDSREVDALAARVAARHLALPRAHHPDSWMRAVFYAGVLALGNPDFDEEIRKICDELKWKPKPRVYHADDHAVCQAYLELYLRRKDPAMIAPTKRRFDYILTHRKTGDVDRDNNIELHSVWSWCDALYMAPPVWAALARATGNSAYLDFALSEWERTSALLYDRDAHLFHRDSSSMKLLERNGQKIFWGRGNGWVMAGLVRVLEQMPAAHPGRARLENQLREMAAALVTVQQPDGLWCSSLLDPASYPQTETSGSGLICYALAWGINHGVLSRESFQPAVLRAWRGLSGCVAPDGKVAKVQSIGAAPVNFDPSLTEDYGVGAVLLAASEVRRLSQTR